MQMIFCFIQGQAEQQDNLGAHMATCWWHITKTIKGNTDNMNSINVKTSACVYTVITVLFSLAMAKTMAHTQPLADTGL